MEYDFDFKKIQVPSSSLSELNVPSGTTFPIFTWNLIILGKEGAKSGVLGELQAFVDKNGRPVNDEITLCLVIFFQPEDMRSVFTRAKNKGDGFAKTVLEICLTRLSFPCKTGVHEQIGLATYNLCKTREEQQRLESLPENSQITESIRHLLLVAHEGLRLRTGQDLWVNGK